MNLIEEEDKKFQYEDEQGGYNLMELRNRNVKFNDKNRPNLFYPFYVNPNKTYKNGLLEISLEKKKGFVEVLPAKSQGIQTVWRWGKEEKARQNLNKVIFGKINQNGGYMIVQKYRKTTKMQRSVWDDKEFVNERGTEAVKEILGNGLFDYPKSVFLVKRIFELGTDEYSIVLDFFAGSGTTGQAVLELNQADKGLRTFIGVQLDEDLDKALKDNPKNETIKNQIKFCDKLKRPHVLSEITSERLRRIMLGKDLNGNDDFEWIEKNKPFGDNLDVYDIETVANFESAKDKTPFDVIDETVYGQEKLGVNEKIKWVCENFDGTQKTLKDK
jgi:adenine specific DNA methylase Mod